MKSDNSAVVYNPESTAAGLNRVKGFDPLKYVRSTENGAVLDLPYQKLWFRLRHPNGKIRIFIKNLSEKIAAVEARVYFDRADSEPAANCIISGVDAEDKVSVAKAQHDAMEKALSDAGFGLQFISVNPSGVKAEEKAVTKKAEKPKQPAKEVKPEKAEEPVKAEIKTEAVKAEPETAPAKAETEEAPPVTDPLLTVVNNIESGSIKVDEQTGEVIEQQAAAEDEPTPVSYDKTTPIDEICAVMTLEDAKNYVIDGGPYNGWKVGTLAERRPVKVLEMIIEKYPTEDNILRAATKLILDSMK
ncbi:MAG TPA: hypothetical protein DCP17_09340 [Ruminococcaceae bacterium]|nr:hypothetical protein [Oscillospiraceae bacterium]